jgi:hypothetical protein
MGANMDEGITKIARIVKRKGKWCVIGHKKTTAKKGKKGKKSRPKYRNFGCYSSEAEAKKRLGQIYMFKGKKAELLEILIKVSDDLDRRGIIHIADALTGCIQSIASEDSESQSVIKLGKIICLLEKKGESELAETVDALLPDVLKLECVDCDVEIPKPRKRISSLRAYNIVETLHKKYLECIIEKDSFEYSKMEELKSMLKQGFSSFPMPLSYEKLPEDADNWWDHFSKRGDE